MNSLRTEKEALARRVHDQKLEIYDLRKQLNEAPAKKTSTSSKAESSGPVPSDTGRRSTASPRLREFSSTTRDSSSKSAITSRDRNSTLLIGDSILRDINERGLEQTTVKCGRGGKITDIHKVLRQEMDVTNYDCDIVHAGTNDCTSEAKFNDGTEALTSLVKFLKDRAPKSKKVLSTVCPRSDNVQHDNRASRLNSVLREVAKAEKWELVENDGSSEDIDNSSLNKDGLHLSKEGTRKLIRHINDSHKHDKIIKRERRSSSAHESDNNRERHTQYHRHHRHHQQPDKRRCFFCHVCGEHNHMKNNCRFGRPITYAITATNLDTKPIWMSHEQRRLVV